jgi:23S rRNA (pseudouridine1915-N3)-methyltransferase
MRARVIAVGTRMPQWVRSACEEYLKRLGGALPVTLTEIEAATRSSGTDTGRSRAQEARRILAAIGAREHVIVLDERGKELSTRELATWLQGRMAEGDDLAFVIGGADGLAQEVHERGNFCLALSRLTLPHALARVLLSEQLYRAHSILTHHPYHRD